ncbi:MAG: phosphomannose isomerase type II C-terminal cupin domain [bacterium]|nr:phosphomannose isomerase type II C-terminal cupin domain [bacterium]
MQEFKPFTEERPWGDFRQFTHNNLSTVKILFIKKGDAFSLQYHNLRTEFWRILSGNPEVTVGGKTIKAKQGDEFAVPQKTPHRIHAIDSDTQILEISSGNFDEGDIVRLEDKYGRA